MAGRRGSRKPPPRRGPTIPPDKARELLEGQVKEAREILARGNIDEDTFEVWNSATTNIMKAAFGEGEHIVYEIRDAGALDRFLAPGEKLPEGHYRQRLEKAIPRIEGAIRQLGLGIPHPLDERAAPAPVAAPAQAAAHKPERALEEAAFAETGTESPTTKEADQKFRILLSPPQHERDFTAWVKADRTAELPIAALFVDIDNFKALNTKYTETTVDETILRPFQERLRECCANRGEGYRQGGDEFIVLLRNSDLNEGGKFAERLRAQLGATLFRVGGETIHVTVSIGVASWPTNGESYHDVLQAANVAKREAKETRNTVRLAPSPSGKMGEQSASPPKASAGEIEKAIQWFDNPTPEVRRSAADQLLSLTYQKLIFHYEPVRGAIRRLMRDEDEETRATALQIHMALMQREHASVGRYYSQPLIHVAETDASPGVRLRAMATIGSTGDSYYCERIYSWIVNWPEEIYKNVDPIGALIVLAQHGLKDRIRDGLRSLLGGPLTSAAVKARLSDALKRISAVP